MNLSYGACFSILRGLRSALLVAGAMTSGCAAAQPLAYNIGFFSYTLSAASETEANAAFKHWAQVIGEELSLDLSCEARLYDRPADVLAAAQAGKVQVIVLCSVDFLAIHDQLPEGGIVSPIRHSSQTEELILVAHRDAPGNSLADFAGKTLHRLTNSTSLLAPLWLESELHRAGLPRMDVHFPDSKPFTKPAKAMLPVFFRQADLCLTTRSSFELLCEMNPQVRSQLRIIAQSPPFVSLVAWSSLPPGSYLHTRAYENMVKLHESTSGRQTLLLFQVEEMATCPDEALESTRALLRSLPPDLGDPSDFIRRSQ